MMNNLRTHSAVQEDVALPAWGTSTSDRLGYDGAGRMIAKRFIPSELDESGGYADTTPVVAFTTRFDKSGNKFFERQLHAENRSHLYQPTSGGSGNSGLDSINRLLQYQRGTQASGGGSVTTPITLPNTDIVRSYNLDHLGNWKTTVYTPVGGSSTTDLRQTNELNQIVSRKVGTDPVTNFVYDKSGNLLDDGNRVMAYDALNRLIQLKRKSDNETIGEYVYDANPARRIRKTVSNGGLTEDIPNGTTDFAYAPGTWQATEERNDEDSPTKQYLWGIYMDELIQQKTYIETSPQELPADDYYALQDLLYRNTALSDDEGSIVEAYDSDAYGNTLLFDTPGTGGDWFADDAEQVNYSTCEIIFCGYRYDPEANLYLARYRNYISELGRWQQRDILLYIPGMNIFQYMACVIHTDPMGLRTPQPYDPPYGGPSSGIASPMNEGSRVAVECSPTVRPIIGFIGFHCSVVSSCKDHQVKRFAITGSELVPGDPNSMKELGMDMGWDSTSSIYGTWGGGYLNRPINWGDWVRYDVLPRTEKGCCEVYNCLNDAFMTANVPAYVIGFNGPNSNTFASSLLTKCNLSVKPFTLTNVPVQNCDPMFPGCVPMYFDATSSVPWAAIGWGGSLSMWGGSAAGAGTAQHYQNIHFHY
jgi:RHS repeat-associated protein